MPKLGIGLQRLDGLKGRRWAFGLRQSDGPIERHDWRGIQGEQLIVQLKDQRPVDRSSSGGTGVGGGDGCFYMILRNMVAGHGAVEVMEAQRNQIPIPAAAVLLLE